MDAPQGVGSLFLYTPLSRKIASRNKPPLAGNGSSAVGDRKGLRSAVRPRIRHVLGRRPIWNPALPLEALVNRRQEVPLETT